MLRKGRINGWDFKIRYHLHKAISRTIDMHMYSCVICCVCVHQVLLRMLYHYSFQFAIVRQQKLEIIIYFYFYFERGTSNKSKSAFTFSKNTRWHTAPNVFSSHKGKRIRHSQFQAKLSSCDEKHSTCLKSEAV